MKRYSPDHISLLEFYFGRFAKTTVLEFWAYIQSIEMPVFGDHFGNGSCKLSSTSSVGRRTIPITQRVELWILCCDVSSTQQETLLISTE